MDQGHLVPDEVTINMLKDEVLKQADPKGFIFDGFPRTNPQAHALDTLLKELNTSITVMLGLEVEEEELKVRLTNRALSSGRADDADPEIIANRIAVYNRETAPVKEFYAAQDKYMAIDGIGTIDSITERLYSAIDSKK
jgi:adenylate kinase